MPLKARLPRIRAFLLASNSHVTPLSYRDVAGGDPSANRQVLFDTRQVANGLEFSEGFRCARSQGCDGFHLPRSRDGGAR